MKEINVFEGVLSKLIRKLMIVMQVTIISVGPSTSRCIQQTR